MDHRVSILKYKKQDNRRVQRRFSSSFASENLPNPVQSNLDIIEEVSCAVNRSDASVDVLLCDESERLTISLDNHIVYTHLIYGRYMS